jgi:hypothetical protein
MIVLRSNGELYIEYTRKISDYNITIITFAYYIFNTPLKCNVNVMTLHLKSSQNTHN